MEPNQKPLSMAYLYPGSDDEQIEFVNQTGGALNVVSPSYFDITDNGDIDVKVHKGFVEEMHKKGMAVTPFLSNHWNRQAGINFLRNHTANAAKLAGLIEEYNLDGINVDIENVTEKEREQYTQFVKELREKVKPGKTVSVAVAANPDNLTQGWQGSYDYKRLGEIADYLVLMSYDEHYESGSAGPVASLPWVKRSVEALSRDVPKDKIMLGIPFFGRLWNDNNTIQGIGVNLDNIPELINTYGGSITFDETARSPKGVFTIREGDPVTKRNGKTLTPGNYTLWFDNDQSIKEKLALVKAYGLKGAAAWALGQEPVSIWEHYSHWLGGSDANTNNPVTLPAPIPPDIATKPPAPIPVTPPIATLPPPKEGIVVKIEFLTVYIGPSIRFKVLTTIQFGDKVIILHTSGGWHLVKLLDGKMGYVKAEYIGKL